MPNETSLLIICITLVFILLLVFVFGIVSYKIYLKNNAKQIADVVSDYKKLNEAGQKQMSESIRLMSELIGHIEHLKMNRT